VSAPPAAPLPRVADLHCDTLLELQGGADIARAPDGHVDLPRLRAGGVGMQFFAAFVSPALPSARAFAEANALLDLLDRACARHPEALERATTAAAVEAAAAGGRTAAVATVENGGAIECDLTKLEALAGRGVRAMTLTHGRHLPWAASSGEPGDGPGGLTAFGREVVAAMHRLGVIVDLSHVHERTFWDVMRVARRPVIASHSCAAALCPTPRNLTDDQLRAIGAAGGVVGVNFFPGFLDPAYFAARAATAEGTFRELERIELATLDAPARRTAEMRRVMTAWRAEAGPAEAGLDTLCGQIEHVAALAGEDGVAFGSDFDGVPELPRGIAGCDAFPAILERLRARGWAWERIHKLAWANAIRVLRANE